MNSEMRDPHSQKNSTCPLNRFNLSDPDELRRRETPLALQRLLELQVKPVAGAFDTERLQGIHRYIFQDVYPWAGEIRFVSISKPGALFPPPQYLRSALDNLFLRLAAENYLKALSPVLFAQQAACYLGELNAVHPFREGNGRTQREFIRELAVNAGHRLLWKDHSQEEMIHASSLSFLQKDYTGLEAILLRGLNP
jgi:cell filamentation protein